MKHYMWGFIPFFQTGGTVMSKKLLMIMNPVAGIKKTNKYLTEIISLFSDNGYEVQVQTTRKNFGADKIVELYAKDKDIIVCIGGDGTVNETISGIISEKLSCSVGYIPSGSTNDFANGLSLNMNPLEAAKEIIEGNVKNLDAGFFNDRLFIYTASFGLFTRASYATPRDLKNSLGYLAYILEGTKEIKDIQPYHIKVKTKTKSFEGDYIFGAICNTKQIAGGIIRFSDTNVDMNDGLLEVLLVKYPKNPAEVMQTIFDAQSGKFESSMFDFFSAEELTISTEDEISWTIDGEYQKGNEKITIKNVKSAIPIIIKDKGKH